MKVEEVQVAMDEFARLLVVAMGDGRASRAFGLVQVDGAAGTDGQPVPSGHRACSARRSFQWQRGHIHQPEVAPPLLVCVTEVVGVEGSKVKVTEVALSLIT